MTGQGVQAFDANGHSTGRDSGDFGNLAGVRFKLVAVCQIGLVSLCVGCRKLWLIDEALLQLGHQAARLEGRERGRRTRVG
jgi:hypothetical protein